MALQKVFYALAVASCITSAYSSSFSESPAEVYLKNQDLRGLEALIKSTWHLEDNSQGIIDSKRAPLVTGHWDSSLTCRCSNLAQISVGEYQSNNTWGKLMDVIYPADSPARFSEFPHLSACLLLPAYLPLPAPPAKSHWDMTTILEIIKDMTQALGLDQEGEQDLLFSVLDSGSILGLDSLGVATRMGMLDYLDYQLQDITKAVGLQKILEKVDDIVNSSDSLGIIKFLVDNFRSHACLKSFVGKLLAGCFENGNELLVEYIHDNHLTALKEALLQSSIVSNHRPDKSRKVVSKSISCMSSAPMSLIRLMCSRGTFDQPLLNTAAEVCRADIVEAVHQEFNGMLPSDESTATALINGCTRVTDYVSPLMPNLAYKIAVQNHQNEGVVRKILDSGNVEGYKLFLRFLPMAFPPSRASMEIANAGDHLEIIRFIFFKRLDGLNLRIRSPAGIIESIQHLIDEVSPNFCAIRYGSTRIIRFLKSQCDEFGIEFPEITMQNIVHSLNSGHRDFLDKFESIFGRPIPGLAVISKIGLNSVSAWHIKFFSSRGYTVKINQNAIPMNSLTDPSELQTLHEYCPHVVPLDSSLLCQLLSEEAPASFEWALANAQPDAQLKTCVIAKVHLGNLPQYKLAHSSKGWLPSQENIDSATKDGHLEFLEWAFAASNGALYPSSEAINQVFQRSDIVTLRLLHHLRPLDFHYYYYDNFTMAAKRGDLNLLRWFPECKKELLSDLSFLQVVSDYTRSYYQAIEDWIRSSDSKDDN